MSNSLLPHGLQHSRLSCPSLSPRVCSNSCPLSWWCYLLILSCLPLLPLPSNLCQHQSFPMSLLFASGGQSIGASASASVLPMNIQGWFPLGLTGWISLQSKGLSRVFSPAPQFESINSSVLRLLYVQISYNEDTTTYFPSHGHPSSRTSFPHWAGKLASWLVIVQNSHSATFYQQTWSTVPKRVKLSALLLPCTWVVKVRPLPRDVISLFLFFHVALIDEWLSPSLFPASLCPFWTLKVFFCF